jgi:hypothetical protein
MRRMLIIGLGGSGGKTLGFLMDELKFRLGDEWGKDALPECWQFVHIDVPSQPDTQGSNLANGVDRQGGRYIGLTDESANYGKLDSVFSAQLAANDQLGYFARWRPNPAEASKIPISSGAGAARGVGRVVTLSGASNIYSGLKGAVDKLQGQRANEDLANIQQRYMKSTDPNAQTLVMMVASIAGGSGASMVLDVADLVRGLQDSNIDGEHTAAFLYTPDVFGDLIAQPGAGSLATISELLAALNRSNEPWSKEEWRVVSGGAPMPTSPGRGPLNLFPVGAKSHGQPFGNSPEDVYRGFSRMMAPLFVDKNVQNDYVAYVTTNALKRAAENPDRTTLMTQAHVSMWDAPRTSFSHFSAWGAATLTLGHDRYSEYSAQRIARRAVENLTGYHLRVADGLPPNQAVAKLVNQDITTYKNMLGLVAPGQTFTYGDITKTALGGKQFLDFISSKTAPFTSLFNNVAATVLKQLKGKAQSSSNLHEEIETQVNESLVNWITNLQRRIEDATLVSAAKYGLVVAIAELNQVRSEISQTINTFPAMATSVDPRALSSGLESAFSSGLSSQGKAGGVMVNQNSSTAQKITGGITASLTKHALDLAYPLVQNALSELLVECIDVLSSSLEQVVEDSDFDLSSQNAGGGVSAAFRNAHITRWPSDFNPIPNHFKPALNEVMVNKVEDFSVKFEEHISSAVKNPGASSIDTSAGQLITQQASTLNGEMENIVGWVLKLDENGAHPHIGREQSFLPSKLATAVKRTPSKAKYLPKLRPADLLANARKWVEIKGSPFSKFTGAGFGTWLGEHSEKLDRKTEFLTAIRQALTFASPLVELDQKLVEAIHGPNSFGYSYWFSTLPISQDNPIVDEIKNHWSHNSASRPANNSSLDKACTIGSDPKEIHISSTPAAPYSAIVFKSLMGPIRRDWDASVAAGATQAFWDWRRARPLMQFVPASPEWIMAFLQGWIVGRLTGLIEINDSDDRANSKVVRVYDVQNSKWHEFPTDLLGVTALGVKINAFGSDESSWNIPAALLESLALAMAYCRGDLGEPLSPLAPYISVLRLGLQLKVEPTHKGQPVGANLGIENVLDSWYRGEVNAAGTHTQLSFGSTASRREDAIKWITSVEDYFDDHVDVEITDGANGNFEKINREYEIKDELREALQTVRRELNREDLGIKFEKKEAIRSSQSAASEPNSFSASPEA